VRIPAVLIITLCALVTALGAANPASASTPPGIAWRQAANDADIAKALEQAQAQKKPVLLYWGAQWCPPCNQLKATLFNRADFIERTRAFVPVYVDGDSPGAQALGTRFKVRGYPTLLLLSPQGQEWTRLPGEANPREVLQVLQLGLAGKRPVRDVLADALNPAKQLSANEWKLLAYYAWEVDEDRLVPAAERPARLAALAQAVPANLRATSDRLLLQALAQGTGAKAAALAPATAVQRQRVLALLADPKASAAQVDVLSNSPVDIADALAAAGERSAVVTALDTALQRFVKDTQLSRVDRIGALGGRVELARPQSPVEAKALRLPPALLDEVRSQIARFEAEITDGYERQAVLPAAAYVLTQSGLVAESDALLQRNLAKSISPYYLMSQLASNAKARDDAPAALRWSSEAYATSVGTATRLQWGAAYLGLLVELSPTDLPTIERVAGQIVAEASRQSDAFYERSGRSLQRSVARLAAWAKTPEQQQVWRKTLAQIEPVCKKLPSEDAQRAACEMLMATPLVKAS